MRQNDNTKVLERGLKYAVLDKMFNTIAIYRYKTVVSNLIGVSTRTLDRTIPYKTDRYTVYLITNVVL